LKFCNYADEGIRLAVGGWTQEGWSAEGWWQLDVGQCIIPGLEFDNNAGPVYFRGEASGGAVWLPTDKTGDSDFCIDTKSSFIISDDYCSKDYHSDLQAKEFGLVEWSDTTRTNGYMLW
jgi:uncharacterized membrane protein